MTVEEEKPGVQGTEARKALERFVVENDDLLTLESRIGRFNIFDALRIMDAEIRHSNFLAFILDPAESHGQGQLFLKALLMDLLKQASPESRPLSPIDLDGSDLPGVEVRREWQHIDLLIMCQELRFFVVIENKIRAKEGPHQLSRYEAAMKKHYPDARPLYVYLTLDADEPSNEKWMPYSHADIHRVLTRVRQSSGNAIGGDVRVFLDHYLGLLGTRFMNDKEIDDLCQKIYKNHRQAMDLIWARVGTPTSGVLAEAQKALEEDHRWEVVPGPRQRLDFVPKAWLEWLPPLGLNGDHRSWIYVRLRSPEGKLSYTVQMVPLTDPAKQNEIVTILRKKCPEFGFKPFPGKKVVKNIKCNVFGVEKILEWGEDDDPDAEAIREQIRVAVKKTLDDLHPKLEKLEVVLKGLCMPSVSRT